MTYGVTAFAGFEAAAALGEEARDKRRSVPASMVAIVVVSGIFYLLVICAEVFAVGRAGIVGFLQRGSQLGYLASRYWSPSVLAPDRRRRRDHRAEAAGAGGAIRPGALVPWTG